MAFGIIMKARLWIKVRQWVIFLRWQRILTNIYSAPKASQMREREDLIQALMKKLFTANFFIPIDFSGQLVKKKK